MPDEYVDQGALIGPKARIQEKFQSWQALGVDGLDPAHRTRGRPRGSWPTLRVADPRAHSTSSHRVRDAETLCATAFDFEESS